MYKTSHQGEIHSEAASTRVGPDLVLFVFRVPQRDYTWGRVREGPDSQRRPWGSGVDTPNSKCELGD